MVERRLYLELLSDICHEIRIPVRSLSTIVRKYGTSVLVDFFLAIRSREQFRITPHDDIEEVLAKANYARRKMGPAYYRLLEQKREGLGRSICAAVVQREQCA